MLSIDDKVFKEGSAVRERLKMYAKFVDELHVFVYTKEDFQEEKVGQKLWIYPSNSKYRIEYYIRGYRFCSRLIKKLKAGRTRVRITSQEGMTNFLATLLSSLNRVPMEIQIHTDIFSSFFRRESYLNRLRLLGYWLGAKRARSIRVVSERIKIGLIDKWRIPKKKIKVLPIHVDVARFANGPQTDFLKGRHPEFRHIILMLSRLTIEKNIELALLVLKDVLVRYPKTGLVIVGEGPLQGSLRKAVYDMNLGGSVIFLPWADDPIPYYKSADIFLLTSNYEGYGLALIEAALSKIPIVTTDVGVVGGIVNKFNALVAPVGDRAKLVSHILFLLQNESARFLMRERLVGFGDLLPDKEKYLKDYKSFWLI